MEINDLWISISKKLYAENEFLILVFEFNINTKVNFNYSLFHFDFVLKIFTNYPLIKFKLFKLFKLFWHQLNNINLLSQRNTRNKFFEAIRQFWFLYNSEEKHIIIDVTETSKDTTAPTSASINIVN